MRKMMLWAKPVLAATVLLFASTGAFAVPPEWVMNPASVVDSGLAATGCTPYSGNINVDRSAALALARSDLASQIETKIETVDEIYQSKQGNAVEVTFKSVSKQIATATLRETVPSKLEVISSGGTEKLCALLVLESDDTREIFRNVVKAVPVSLSIEEEDALFDQGFNS